MGTMNKVLWGFMMAALAAWLAYSVAQQYRISALNLKVARLETALSECGYREREAVMAIERQNAAVEAVRVDTVYVARLIKQAERKYAEVREVVSQSLERDTSCENKIGNIDYALRRFHGLGVRPAGGGKD